MCSDSAYSINCICRWAPTWEKKGWKKPGGEIKNLDIIQRCYAIYRRIEKGLTLTHAGTKGNELPTAWPCSTRSVKSFVVSFVLNECE